MSERGRRWRTVYALRADPDYLVLDRAFALGISNPGDLREYEPVAQIRGDAVYSSELNLQEALLGEVDGLEVRVIRWEWLAVRGAT